ncbi:MAG: site-2 protease family protein, partial [Rhodobacteraceae bacterium]|nr:site-2 protease family protein [Paracoccaceae bacterium]
MDILALLNGFGSTFWTILAFVVALSIIVAIHEYGHYIVGRWSGIGADVFSLGFGPVLYSRYDKRGTKWQIAAIPLGGYVKFKGDANAASGKDADAMEGLDEEALRHTMHGAPLWARTATVAAGPIFNFILSTLVFAAVFMSRGQIGDTLVVGEVRDLPPPAYEISEGDEIRKIAGMTVPGFDEPEAFEAFATAIPIETPLDYVVERDGVSKVVSGPYPYPPIVLHLAPQSAAYGAGLKVGDVITGIDGRAIVGFSQLKEAVETGEGKALALDVWREGESRAFTLTPRRVDEPLPEGGFQTQWRIGIGGGLAFEPATETLGPGQAVWGGVVQT